MRGTEFAELSSFIAVAEHKNFTRAAESLHISPSTLSQTIRALEKRLGVALLFRTTRSVSLTDAGTLLLARTRPAFEELKNAVSAVSDMRERPRGTLRLSVASIPARMIVAPILKDFLEAYPEIVMDLSIDNNTVDIVSGRFDAGIRYGRRIAQDMLVVRAMPESRLIAVASPEYLARFPAPRTIEELHDHACIRFRFSVDTDPIAWEFERNKKKIEIEVDGPLIVNDVDIMVRAAKDGMGITYIVESYIAEDLAEGRLIPLLTEFSPAHHSYYLYYANRHQQPAPLKAFIDFLKKNARDK